MCVSAILFWRPFYGPTIVPNDHPLSLSYLLETLRKLCSLSNFVKFQHGFFAKTHPLCSAHSAPYLILPFIKASFPPCGNLQTFPITPALNVDSDFRPISLTPILSKILESFPYHWLLQSIIAQVVRNIWCLWIVPTNLFVGLLQGVRPYRS